MISLVKGLVVRHSFMFKMNTGMELYEEIFLKRLETYVQKSQETWEKNITKEGSYWWRDGSFVKRVDRDNGLFNSAFSIKTM
jgi:hypothetical protein